MSSVKDIIEEISKQLRVLYSKTGYFSDGAVKDSIVETQNYIKTCLENNSFIADKVMAPFVSAANSEGALKEASLDFLIYFYQKITENRKPSDKITARLISFLIAAPISQGDTLNYKTVKFISIVFGSPAFSSISHSINIFRSANYALQMYKISYGKSNHQLFRSAVFLIFNNLLRKTINSPDEINKLEKIKNNLKALKIKEDVLEMFSDPIPETTTLADIDLAIAATSLVYAINVDNQEASIIQLTIEILYAIACSGSPLIKKRFYASLLSSVFSPAIYKAMLNEKVEPSIIGNLVATIHEKSGRVSIEPLIDIIKDSILATADNKPKARLAKVIQTISSNKKILLDIQLLYPNKRILHMIVESLCEIPPDSEYPSRHSIVAINSLLMSIKRKPFTPPQNKKKAKNDGNLIDLFASNPGEAIDKMIKKGIIKDNMFESVAKFLYKEKKLDKKTKSKYIASQKTGFINAYFNQVGPKHKSFIELFKKSFSSLYPPSNLYYLDVLFAAFARFVKKEKNMHETTDSLYVLTFNTFILYNNFQTEMEDYRITFDEFVKMNNEYCKGIKVNMKLLKSVYNKIGKKEIFPVVFIPQLTTYEEASNRYDLFKESIEDRGLTADDEFFLSKSLIAPCVKTLINTIKLIVKREKSENVYKSISQIIIELYSSASSEFDIINVKNLNEFLFSKTTLRNKPEKVTEEMLNFSKVFYNSVCMNLQYVTDDFDIDAFLREANSLAIITKDYSIMQNIIINSSTLNRITIIKFTQALLNIARAELNQQEPDTTTAMRIPEFIEANKVRPLFTWLKMWEPFKKFIIDFGLSKNPQVADLVISMHNNILSQIVDATQQRSFNFQATFMEPFLIIFDQQENQFIREKIISCIFDIVKSKGHILKGAWDTVFQIMTTATMDDLAYEIRSDFLEYISNNLVNIMQPYVVHMMAFASMHIMKSRDEKEASKQIMNFVSIAQNMRNRLFLPYQCLFDYFKIFITYPGDKAIKASQEAIVKIFERREHFPHEAIDFFFKEVLREVFFGEDSIYIKKCEALHDAFMESEEDFSKWDDVIELLGKFTNKNSKKIDSYIEKIDEIIDAIIEKDKEEENLNESENETEYEEEEEEEEESSEENNNAEEDSDSEEESKSEKKKSEKKSDYSDKEEQNDEEEDK